MRIAMFVRNNCTRDARVLKEAASLGISGHEVTIVAVVDNNCQTEYEEHADFRLFRLCPESPYDRIMRRLRRAPGKLGAKQCQDNHTGGTPRPATRAVGASLASGSVAGRLHDLLWRALRRVPFVPGRLIRVWRFFRRVLGITRRTLWRAIRMLLLWLHRPLKTFDYYIKGVRFVSSHPVDVVHCHDLNTLWIGVIAAKLHGVQVVYDSHELFPDISVFNSRQRRYLRFVEGVLIRHVDRVITVNGSIAEELQRRHGIDKPTVVMNCPEQPKALGSSKEVYEFWGAMRPLRDNGARFVLYQGGFAPNRGLETLVRSAAYFASNVFLIMLGWGRIEGELKSLRDQLKLGEKVIFVSPVAREALLSFTERADVGVIPYQAVGLNNFYATPNKLFEYLMAGIPVVASDFPELRRVVTKYGVGELCDPTEPESIARAVNSLLESGERYDRIRENTKVAASIFNWETESKKLLDLYSGIGLDKGGPTVENRHHRRRQAAVY